VCGASQTYKPFLPIISPDGACKKTKYAPLLFKKNVGSIVKRSRDQEEYQYNLGGMPSLMVFRFIITFLRGILKANERNREFDLLKFRSL
jgi:hypothetical protein